MLNEQVATNVGPSRLDIAYERRGDPRDPVVLLVMGVAAQLVNWPEGFVDALVSRRLHVIRFDNRDAGHSTHLDTAPPPDLPAALAGDLSSAAYTLSDMAADAVGLLDALGIGAAHIVGASMGGAIAQTMAIEFPERVRSLTTMMSTTGAPGVGYPHPEVMAALVGGTAARTREEHVDRAVRIAGLVGSPGYPAAGIAERAGLAYDRAHDETAAARQAVATVASGDRTSRLGAINVPTLVIHGTSDAMCDVSGGRATAAAIPGAELVLIEGMGHDLPPALWEPIAGHIGRIVARGDAKAGSQGQSSHSTS